MAMIREHSESIPIPKVRPRARPTRFIWRVLRWAGVALGVLLIGAIAAFLIDGYADLGHRPDGDALIRLRQSPQWHDEQFSNVQPMWGNRDPGMLLRLFQAVPDVRPDAPVPVVHGDSTRFFKPAETGLRVTWFGHSSVLLELDSARVLIDPIWSERASPVQWAGPKRWYASPIALQDLPPIDAVVISHDHYDHMDYETIRAMKAWSTVFIVPLGNGSHLRYWGIPEERIIELDWWQSARIRNIDIVATPARHASGRIVPEGDETLWAGYAFLGERHRAWYSGDTGLHSALADIGTRLGPFDVTLIESGQYSPDWPDWHLGPEQAVEAHRMVRGDVMIPVHWALFKLASHGWTEPVERVLAASRCNGVTVLVPKPGESVEPTRDRTGKVWWPSLTWRTAAQYPVVATRNGVSEERVPVAGCRS